MEESIGYFPLGVGLLPPLPKACRIRRKVRGFGNTALAQQVGASVHAEQNRPRNA